MPPCHHLAYLQARSVCSPAAPACIRAVTKVVISVLDIHLGIDTFPGRCQNFPSGATRRVTAEETKSCPASPPPPYPRSSCVSRRDSPHNVVCTRRDAGPLRATPTIQFAARPALAPDQGVFDVWGNEMKSRAVFSIDNSLNSERDPCWVNSFAGSAGAERSGGSGPVLWLEKGKVQAVRVSPSNCAWRGVAWQAVSLMMVPVWTRIRRCKDVLRDIHEG